ncbi:UDP-2,3-diacylglucosamine diphosphatase [Kordiimonas pumila]|uniref:UDP-2,3-diacylglucosamine diphosphatase n=1 Tax=Kordiimonas pumila TaxID=2161677 RepID=A0ABV7D5T5_9PROT|nr:UDP-2,3-diacylglucosamine diphosphatase [Kordiimonas pumila]
MTKPFSLKKKSKNKTSFGSFSGFSAVQPNFNEAPAATEPATTMTSSIIPLLAAAGLEPPGDAPPAEDEEITTRKKGARHYRAVFISDTHLGTRAARVDLLLDFLKSISCEQLYLVGDIVDGWQIKRSWFWDTTHNDVIRRVLKMAKHGTKVTYIPGNHDEGLRGFEGHDLAGVSLEPEVVFEGANGKRYWVLHGDQFDGVVKYAKWLAHVGDYAYVFLLRLNTAVNKMRRLLGYDYWSLSAYLKHKVKNAVEYIGKFEEAVAAEARRRGVDGVICGHIHQAERRMFDDIEYMNDGDWVESCTALVEHDNGEFEILYWAEIVARRNARRALKENARKKPRKNGPVPIAAE